MAGRQRPQTVPVRPADTPSWCRRPRTKCRQQIHSQGPGRATPRRLWAAQSQRGQTWEQGHREGRQPDHDHRVKGPLMKVVGVWHFCRTWRIVKLPESLFDAPPKFDRRRAMCGCGADTTAVRLADTLSSLSLPPRARVQPRCVCMPQNQIMRYREKMGGRGGGEGGREERERGRRGEGGG